MITLDALILNIDRHTGNHGVIVDNDTQELIKMGPVFDHNRSLLYNMKDFELRYFEDLANDLAPGIGEDFVEMAREAATPEILRDIKNLHGFTFKRHDKYNLPEERIKLLEKVISSQIEKIAR